MTSIRTGPSRRGHLTLYSYGTTIIRILLREWYIRLGALLCQGFIKVDFNLINIASFYFLLAHRCLTFLPLPNLCPIDKDMTALLVRGKKVLEGDAGRKSYIWVLQEVRHTIG
jgi:hypothetical protein